jgi:hypothetical protein
MTGKSKFPTLMHSEPGMVKAGDEQEAENHPRGMALNQK